MAGSPFSSPRGPSDGTFRRGGAVARPGKTHPAGRASGAAERADGPAERTKSPAPPERAWHPTKNDSEKIEEIRILKGKAAEEAYGEKGARGVVVVTTKKK